MNNQALIKAAMAIEEALSLLDVDRSILSDSAALKTAYRGAARKHHPDAGGLTETMQKINEAYDLLSQGAGSDFGADDEEVSPIGSATDILDANLTRFKKGHGWWKPPHNLAINTALSNINGWMFTILPLFPDRQAYRPARKGKPEGLVIDPNWSSVRDLDISYDDLHKLQRIIDKIPTIATLDETIKDEVVYVEKKFGVEVPKEVKAYLAKEMPKVAARRWGTNRLRRKKILVPFDGTKPIELGSWD